MFKERLAELQLDKCSQTEISLSGCGHEETKVKILRLFTYLIKEQTEVKANRL